MQGSSTAWVKPAAYCRLRDVQRSLVQRGVDVTNIHTEDFPDPDGPEAFAVPTGLCFIPDVEVCHSREQASLGICRELHPSEDVVQSRGGHSFCSWHGSAACGVPCKARNVISSTTSYRDLPVLLSYPPSCSAVTKEGPGGCFAAPSEEAWRWRGDC